MRYKDTLCTLFLCLSHMHTHTHTCFYLVLAENIYSNMCAGGRCAQIQTRSLSLSVADTQSLTHVHKQTYFSHFSGWGTSPRSNCVFSARLRLLSLSRLAHFSWTASTWPPTARLCSHRQGQERGGMEPGRRSLAAAAVCLLISQTIAEP